MALEFEFDNDPLEKLTREPFLQAEALVAINQDIAEKNLTEKNLRTWLRAAMMVQAHTGCAALAFNQLNSDLLIELGLLTEIPPSLMLVKDIQAGRSVLLVNPRVSIPNGVSRYPSIEGCGSIDYGKKVYVIDRPEVYQLTGQVFDGWELLPIQESESHRATRRYENVIHEDMHLRHGGTALSTPDLLWNITQAEVWQNLTRRYPFTSADSLQKSLAELGQHGLVIPFEGKTKTVPVTEIGKY
jgi:hypothetical protein